MIYRQRLSSFWWKVLTRACFLLGLVLSFYLILLFQQIHRLDESKQSVHVVHNRPVQECLIQECNEHESNIHGNLFSSMQPVWSSCYADLFLQALDNHSREVEVLLDIGANKAYAVSSWLSFFLPKANISPQSLGEFLSKTNMVSYPCGSCDDCKDESMGRTQKIRRKKLQIHAFEPQPGTVHVLNSIKTWMNVNEKNSFDFHIHPLAVSARSGQIYFKKCNPGNEVCSLDLTHASENEQVLVKVTSVDDFVRDNGLNTIDLMKIDTEGFEPAVFQGAQKLFREQRVRIIIFEHLQEAVWKNTSLKHEVNQLNDYGYVCYMTGKTGLIRVSRCWSNKFVTRHSNILCVLSSDRQLLMNIDKLKLKNTLPIKCQ